MKPSIIRKMTMAAALLAATILGSSPGQAQPTVSLAAPASGASYAAPLMLTLSASPADVDGTVTNVAFYLGTNLLGHAASAPFTLTTANIFAGTYALTAVATDNNGLSATSSVVSLNVTNTPSLSVLQSIKTVFVIAMENHDLVQKNPTGSPEQILGNPAAPYFNSLITPGNSNAVQTAWATHMFSCAINGEHPSEPNYVWEEAGTDFGVRTDNDPGPANTFSNVVHLSAQLTAAGIPWRTYQEDVQLSTGPTHSASGSTGPTNIYNGTTDYNYAVKHNPMEFFYDTQNLNCYPFSQFWLDLTNNNLGRYNWITPDQYNEWHSSLPNGYTYYGVHYTGDQAAIAEGDNCLSIIIPQIMASQAYKDHGVIIIWTDETESTDDTNTTLPYVIISPLAKGNAYASTLPYSHSSDLKTMDEIFQLAYQTNAIPAAYLDAQNTGYNYVNGSSAPIYDLSDFFTGTSLAVSLTSPVANASFTYGSSISLAVNVSDPNATVTNVAYYSGTNLLGNATSAPFGITWTNAAVGAYAITAVATDNAGLAVTSSIVNIVVVPAPVAYSQNFDVALSNSATALPPGFTSMVIAGANSDYTAANPITAAAIALATADTQTLLVWNVGTAVTKSGSQSFNIGCWDTLNDRALGTDPTGTGAQVIQLAITNNSGAALAGVTFSYNCKCLTNGSVGTEESELPGYCFFYSTAGPTGTNVAANWKEVGVAGAVVGATNSVGVPIANGLCLPNFTEGTTMSSGPVAITFATPLTNHGVMYFRWADDNNEANSPDQMLAIDDISVSGNFAAGPLASITSPANNSTFTPGSSIPITASASENGGAVTNVAFYAGSTLLGNAVSAPYSMIWPNVSAGSYALTVVASDAAGLMATSAVVNISVAFTPPTIGLTSPANGAAYSAPASIPLVASVADTSGTVTNVAFYQGSTLLANVGTSPFSYTWANVPAGSYTLTAQATDNNGAMATSAGVSVTVGNPLVASFTGVYTQNFDLALSNSTTVMPAGFQAMYLPGSHFTYTNAPGELLDSNAIATATSGSGASTLIVWNVGSPVTDASYQLFNIGSWDSLNDRALGTDPTGTGGTVIQLALTNNTGISLAGVSFAYTEKCLTNGSTSNGSYTDNGTEAQELPGYEFFYSITGDTSPTNWCQNYVLGATNWIQGTVSNAGPVTLMFPTPLTNNGVMYFRWADDNCVASSPDQMYAIDNISITSINAAGPVVSITSPTNTENYLPGTGVTISVSASDANANITSVGLYLDGSLAYTFTSPPYVLPIPGGEIPAGSYSIYAEATDASGLMATSSVVNITIAYVPPTVSVTSPAAGTTFAAYSTIPLAATAASADGTVTNVAFYQGSTLIANVTSSPFNYSWQNVAAGTYMLTALATDSHGLATTSSVVSITVTNGFGLSLASPTNNENYLPGASVSLSANVFDAGGTVTNVEFYANGTPLGGVTSSPYTLTWPNVPAGLYTLVAVASDVSGTTATSSVVNISVESVHVPPVVSLASPANNAAVDVALPLTLAATASSTGGTVTNVSFYQNTFLVASVSTVPYTCVWTNAPSGNYSLTAVATDNSGASTTSSVVKITATNSLQIATLRQIKTIFVIALENHDLVQANPEGSPEQLLGNPACPYFNSLITPGNSNAVQSSYATHMFSAAINGEHPSEPNYIWQEAGTDFGVRTDNDPSHASANVFTNVIHLSGQLSAAGIPWRTYQEDLEYTSSELVSASGTGVAVNPYNGTTDYNYAVKHNPMAFFNDTQLKNCYPLTNFWTDLTNGNIGRYNWITPDQYNEMHSSLPGGYTYNGTAWTGDQAAIAEGDNALSIMVPKIMASQAYKDNGAIIIWTDETESTDDTNTTLPYVILSPLAKGNAYASTLPYSHSSDLKTMDELFGVAYQTNLIPLAYNGAPYLDAQNTGTNYVDGRSAVIYDLSDFFVAPVRILGTTAQTGGNFQLSFSGPAGKTYEVLATTDLTLPQSAWTVVDSGTFAGTNVVFTDTNSADYAGRYYVVKSP